MDNWTWCRCSCWPRGHGVSVVNNDADRVLTKSTITQTQQRLCGHFRKTLKASQRFWRNYQGKKDTWVCLQTNPIAIIYETTIPPQHKTTVKTTTITNTWVNKLVTHSLLWNLPFRNTVNGCCLHLFWNGESIDFIVKNNSRLGLPKKNICKTGINLFIGVFWTRDLRHVYVTIVKSKSRSVFPWQYDIFFIKY